MSDDQNTEHPKELRPAALYSTWQQVATKESGPKYFVVWQVWLKQGVVYQYDLLQLFTPEFKSITPEKFEMLISKRVLREWKG